MPDNPLAGSSDLNARRIIAYGVRNPFRLTIRPGTNEVWLGDVGWNNWEEINRIADPLGSVENFGWPCYEGTGTPIRLRQRESDHLREPVRAARRRRRSLLRLQPQRPGRLWRDVPDWQLLGGRRRLLHERTVPGRLRRRALLRRLLPRLHLGHVCGRKRAPERRATG